jgi:hypothetical protein
MRSGGGPLVGRSGPLVGRVARLWVTFAIACRITSTTQPDAIATFSGERAFATLQTWLERPRVLGDARRTASIDALARDLERRGADRIERIEHTATDPGGTGEYALVEIAAHFREHAPRRFVLATHYDIRPWADEDPDAALHDTPIVGANDGTSGLAVVLELAAPLLARLPDDVGVSIVLFDGEELGHPGGTGYCMGSKHLAERIAGGLHPLLARAELGIVLDMVGDRDLRIQIEPGSRRAHPALVDHVWGTARALGIDAFDPTVRPQAIVDDHKFLTRAGIPSILVIDHDYPAWHTSGDTIDRVSAESLGAVGSTVLESLVRWYER